jgi:hypothetical protein
VSAERAYARVEAWVREGEVAAREVLAGHQDALERLAGSLLAHDSLDGEAIRRAARLG